MIGAKVLHLVALVVLIPALGWADFTGDFQKCVEVPVDADRLTCFDALAKADKPASEVLIDVPKLSGLSKKKVAAVLGKPEDCEDSKYGEKCTYTPQQTEIMFIKGKADWITVNELADLPFAPESITKLGFEAISPTFSNKNTIRWEGIKGLREVMLAPGGDGKVSYAYIKSVTK